MVFQSLPNRGDLFEAWLNSGFLVQRIGIRLEFICLQFAGENMLTIPLPGIALLLVAVAGMGGTAWCVPYFGTCARACESAASTVGHGSTAVSVASHATTGSLHEWSFLFPSATLLWLLGGGALPLAEGLPNGES